MGRYVIAGVVGCVYVAGSILIVSIQGQAYRDDLARMRPAAAEIDKTSPAVAEDKDEATPPVVASDRDTARSEPVTTEPATEPVADRAPRPEVKGSSPAPLATELARATPATSLAEKNPAASSGAKAMPANPLANDPFWNHPKLTRVRNVAYLSPQEELALGADFHELVVRFNPLVEEPGPWLSRVDQAAAPFLDALGRKEIKYQFFILDSDVVNAFSTPGGFVYISRGLVDLIGEDEDYALQYAIGHEIAHVDLKHAIKCLQDPGVMKVHMGTLQKLFFLILPFGYLRTDTIDQEFEADDWAANRMQRIPRTRREILVFLNKLDGYARSHGFGEGRAKPKRGGDLSPLENHYRAQTAASKRLKHLKELMDQSAKAPK